MKKNFEIGDSVRPIDDSKNAVWRVTEITGNRVTAEKSQECLEPGEENHTAWGPASRFVSIEINDKPADTLEK